MIHIVVHLHAVPGAEKGMRAYEKKALGIFRDYGGEVIAAFKPEPALNPKPMPDEVQILRIASMAAFKKFMAHPKRLALAGERERVIKKTEVFVSKPGKNPYIKKLK